jgi:hypothetical protein
MIPNDSSGESHLASTERNVVSDLKHQDFNGAQHEVDQYRQQAGNGHLSKSDHDDFNATLHTHGFPNLDIVDAKDGNGSHSLIVSKESEHCVHKIEDDLKSGASGEEKADKQLAGLKSSDGADANLFKNDLKFINSTLSGDNLPTFHMDNGSWTIKPPADSTPVTPHFTTMQPSPEVSAPSGSPSGGTPSGGAPEVGGGTPAPESNISSPSGSPSGSDSSAGGSVGPLTGAVGEAPANAEAMYKFFTSHGLSPAAAAGIIGNIAQESGGNPESVGSGGNGLIGWTPPLPGAVTGNPEKDLQFQLNAVMQYIGQNGSVKDINTNASSPAAAAAYFMSKYEKPLVSSENSEHRESAANAVAQMFA